MDLLQKVQQLVEQLPDNIIQGMPQDAKKMIVIKFGGTPSEVKLSPKVQKILKVIETLSDDEKKELMANCPLSHNE